MERDMSESIERAIKVIRALPESSMAFREANELADAPNDKGGRVGWTIQSRCASSG